MSNKFCISTKKLIYLRKQKNIERAKNQAANFKHLSMSQMMAQMENDSGEFYQAMSADTAKFTQNTEYIELSVSIDLSEFYFPKMDAEICFEMKPDFNSSSTVAYDEIVNNFETDTHVDCSIKKEGKKFDFQIKRYPQKYLALTSEAMVNFIKKVIKGYANMSGTILIIVIQPKDKPEGFFDFNEIHKAINLIKDENSFNEINFVFNDENQQLIWRQIYPGNGYSSKPLVFESEKYQKLQTESKKKLEQ